MRPITLATYNIHKCVGLDGRWDPRRIFNVIEELDADLLAIQEFDNRYRAGRGDIAPETFADATGMHLLVQPTMTEGARFHGNLLLSRWPVASWAQMELAVPGATLLTLADLDSTNGTRLNGEPVHKSELADGDRIGLGGPSWTFKCVVFQDD